MRNFMNEALKLKMETGESFSDMASKRTKEIYEKHGATLEEILCTEIGMLWATIDSLLECIGVERR